MLRKSILIVLISLFPLLLSAGEINILFSAIGFASKDSESKAINKYGFEIMNFNPLNNYSDSIKFYSKEIDKNDIYIKINNNNFVIDDVKFIKISENIKIPVSLYITIIESSLTKGKGGKIENLPFIVISSNTKEGILLHEIGHALFDLGDEYGGILDFPPSEREISKYKNLTLSKNNSEWESVKKNLNDPLIDYYEGGLERDKNVFHSYPFCLMQKVKYDLCPVCLYYSIAKLNGLTGENKTIYNIKRDIAHIKEIEVHALD